MKRKSIINFIAAFIISVGPILPFHDQNAEAAPADHWLNYKFDGFSDDVKNQFSVNGDAQFNTGAGSISLTKPTPLQSGAVFNKNALCPKDNYSFSTAFSFQISNKSPDGPSDGLTFTLQAGTTSPTANGGSLGYYGIKPSFAVKYDTFQNPGYSDPSANYIGLAENGTVTNQTGRFTDLDKYNSEKGTNYVLSNGTKYYTWIDYNGQSKNVQVRLGTSPDRTSSSIVLDVDNIDLGAIFGGQPFYAGFTGSTGSPNYETHDIYSWYLVNEYAPIETLDPFDPQNDYYQNRPPTAPDDTKTTSVNTPVSGKVNGTDPDGDSLNYQTGDQPKNGTVTVNADGNWTYTPKQDYVGQDSFTVIVDDGKCATTVAKVTVDITETPPANQPPTASGENVTTEKGKPATGKVEGKDPEGDPLTYTKGKDPEHGSVTVNEDGTWTYTPDPDYVGDDSFTVIVKDDKGNETEVTITVGVTEPNNPTPPSLCGPRVALINGSFEEPTARMPGDTGSPGSEHAWQYFQESEVPGWKTSASDKFIQIMKNEYIYSGMKINPPDGNQYAELNAEQVSALYQDVKTTPGQTIYWRFAHKGLLGVDTMSVQIGSADIPLDELPVIKEIRTGNTDWEYYSGSYTVPAGQTTTRFAFNSVDAAGGNQRYGNLLDDIFLGTGPCGVVTKSVDRTQDVQVGDVLTYTVNFKNDGGDVAEHVVLEDKIPAGTEYVPDSLQIIDGPNAGPKTDISGDDQGEFNQADNKIVVRLGNGETLKEGGRVPNTDTLPGGSTIQFKVKVLPGYSGKQIMNKAVANYDNLLENKSETRESNEVGSAVKLNQPPTASDDSATTEKGKPTTGKVAGTDPDGDPLKYTKGKDPEHGSVTVNEDGTWTYTPDPDYVGDDSFTVIVKDDKGNETEVTITVGVTEPDTPTPPTNQPPTAPDDSATTEKGKPATGKVEGKDPEGDPLTYTKGKDPEHGNITVNEDGTWTYTPDPDYVGDDSFTVIVKDDKGNETEVTITVGVTEPDTPTPPTNQPPAAPDDSATTEKDTPTTGKVEGSDPEGDPLTYTKGKDPEHGNVTVNEDGTWTYTPDPDYVGDDSFTVIVKDDKGNETEVTITVGVTEPDTPTPPTNQPPTAPDDSATTEKDTPTTGKVEGSDPEGDPLTYTKGKDPEHGSVTVNEDGTWTYTPDPGYEGPDSFTVIVDDSKGGKTTVTVTVDVTGSGTNPDPGPGTDPGTNPGTDPGPSTDPGTNPGSDPGTSPETTPNPGTSTDPVQPNQVPSVPSYVTETPINTPATGKVSGTDADGDSLTYSKGSDPKHGTVTVNPDGTWTYVPDRDYTGTDSFTVTVSDGRGGTTTSVVTVDVTGTGTETGTTNPGTSPEPTDPTTPADPGNEPEPTDPGPGTTPTHPGTGTTPANPEGGSTPTTPETGTAPDSGNDSGSPLEDNGTVGGESGKAPSPAEQAGEQSGNKLPNTATNVYNLGFLGIIILLAGLFIWRKRKV